MWSDVSRLWISYYRRASAYFYSGDFEASLRDFKQCLALNPSNAYIRSYSFTDSSIRSKVAEVSKIVKRMRFEAAIHVENISFADQVIFKDLSGVCSRFLTRRLLSGSGGPHDRLCE